MARLKVAMSSPALVLQPDSPGGEERACQLLFCSLTGLKETPQMELRASFLQASLRPYGGQFWEHPLCQASGDC